MRKVKGWDKYFLDLLPNIGSRSKDPDTQVGCLLVKDTKILGYGYNGFPPGYPETPELWERGEKYDHVIHAEMNAIFNSNECLRGSTCYVSMLSCANCAKHLAAVGVKRIIYTSVYLSNETLSTVSFDIFSKAGIECILIKT